MVEESPMQWKTSMLEKLIVEGEEDDHHLDNPVLVLVYRNQWKD